jgi:hypothetical protein
MLFYKNILLMQASLQVNHYLVAFLELLNYTVILYYGIAI